MIGIPSLRTLDQQTGFRVWLATSPIDMRLGFDQLMELAKSVTGQAVIHSSAGVACTHLFVFRSRGGDRLKMLYWDQGGLILWYKKLGTEDTHLVVRTELQRRANNRYIGLAEAGRLGGMSESDR